jgi:endonuclease/exonuclease/phosphatase family metal-dependent hydrolase
MNLTLMSYNIKVGTWTDDGLGAVADVIAHVNPDVVALQEVDRGMPRTGKVDQAAWLGERLGMQAVYAPATGGATFNVAEGEYGIALLSRWPVVEHERRLLFNQPLPLEQRPPRYYVEQRAVLGCAIDIRGVLIDVFCTHFDLTQDQRIPQAREVAEFCAEWHPNRPVVLMGDLNAFPDAPEVATLRAGLVDMFHHLGVEGDERLTFPSGPLGSRTDDGWSGAIDYIFVSEHFRPRRIDVIREATPASDHAPVVAVVELLA